ncbi:MAG: hypothetical protein ACFCU3_10790, partial [Verrucomicrobiales bacterium]
CLVAAFLLSGASAHAQEEALVEEKVYSADDFEGLVAAEGTHVAVQGLIREVGRDAQSGTVFLNFEGAGRNGFYCLVFPRNFINFPETDFESIYSNQSAVVTGTIAIHRGQPQIILENPEQVSVAE